MGMELETDLGITVGTPACRSLGYSWEGSGQKPSCGFSSLKGFADPRVKDGVELTGKGIDCILRKTIARAYRWGRRIGVTSWLFDTGIGSCCFGIQGQEALWGHGSTSGSLAPS